MPVMARCRCGIPVAECLEHNPPALFAPTTPPSDTDPYGITLDEAPPVAVTIAITGVTATVMVVVGGVTAVAWAVGVIIDTLRGRT